MNDLAKQFGANLRQVRKGKGISQDNLALLAEIDRSYIGRIERGEVNITLDKAYQLACALECDLVELLPPLSKA
ncbi:helix-turn-helix domain-containing protein [Vibrio breoganii]|uniref:helix-turn-helix domain-containing protein n=1 Tax=Vibrio breoganii TaxID=553239 RepID=UPI000C839C57|nr:helix-turn-helix transcriptional regulator [Vibrio breoganii]PMG94270.1 transcriptional regulator [Vibrio breoganii]PMI16072.1 transcriptional regulator [Vibrio breoganii]PMJ46085.1 transcriptional regulator [Vibrio breoganii]PMK55029.1 transcriptional regulator [Vibrio breoganii]PMM19839.1 transcriptional regulator [Vibrio breoganii]